jgi:hypothetical protein
LSNLGLKTEVYLVPVNAQFDPSFTNPMEIELEPTVTPLTLPSVETVEYDPLDPENFKPETEGTPSLNVIVYPADDPEIVAFPVELFATTVPVALVYARFPVYVVTCADGIVANFSFFLHEINPPIKTHATKIATFIIFLLN